WIAALFFGMSVLWIIALIKEKDYTTLWIAALILFVLIIIFFAAGAHNIFIGRLEPSELFRKKLTRDALSFISQHPFKGLGPDMFYWKVPYHFRTHNILLETLVNLGIPGLAVLVWFIYTLFGFIAKGILKAASLKERYLQLGIITSLAAFIGHNTVDYFWHVTEILGLFWMLAGLGACVSINGSAPEKAEGSDQ
ncbi:MAG: O-antigen ligase family protein, partial [Candidatus Omnitrophica bacterium]|nr:O-antigen ligase family protein [Candidatus Omnitrophota bacterium]